MDGREFPEVGSSRGGPPALLRKIMTGLRHAKSAVLLRHLAGDVTSTVGYEGAGAQQRKETASVNGESFAHTQ